ncbi:MAG: hypothetical protein L6R42_004540, partial [Xanthoria sp. 1 TBL-2021]
METDFVTETIEGTDRLAFTSELEASTGADGITELIPAPIPVTSELRPRQISFQAYAPQNPNTLVQEAARAGQEIISDVDLPRHQCWVLHGNTRDCRKELQDLKEDFKVSAFHNCYEVKNCPMKRSRVAEPIYPTLENAKKHDSGCLTLSTENMKLVLEKARKLPSAILREPAPDKCCYVRVNWSSPSSIKCMALAFPGGITTSTELFWQCYSLEQCPQKRNTIPELDAGPTAINVVKRAALSGTSENYGPKGCPHGDIEERAFVATPRPRLRSRCTYGTKLAPKIEKGCTLDTQYCIEKTFTKDCKSSLYYCTEVVLESICKLSDDDTANNVKTQIFVEPCWYGWDIRTEKGKNRLRCKDINGHLVGRSAVADHEKRESLPGKWAYTGPVLKVDKRDLPAAMEYGMAANSSSVPSSDVTLNYLKCKDFCRFDKSSPPTCLPNCYVIDGQVQLDAPGLLIPPPANATASKSGIDPSPTTFRTSTTSQIPTFTFPASKANIKGRAPPGLITANNGPTPPCKNLRWGTKESKILKPGCTPTPRNSCRFKELICDRGTNVVRNILTDDNSSDTLSLGNRDIKDELRVASEVTADEAKILLDINSAAAQKSAYQASEQKGKRSEERTDPVPEATGNDNTLPGIKSEAIKKLAGKVAKQKGKHLEERTDPVPQPTGNDINTLPGIKSEAIKKLANKIGKQHGKGFEETAAGNLLEDTGTAERDAIP